MTRPWSLKRPGLLMLAFVVSLGLAGMVQAQGVKVGVVDLQAVLDASLRGKAAKERLKELGDQLQREIQAKREFKERKEEELQNLRSEIQRQGLVLSGQARMGKEEEFRKSIRELKRFIDDTNNFIDDATQEFREKEVRETQLLLVAIRDVVREVGTRGQYTLILEGNDSAALVLYIDATVDLTEEVIQLFDQTSAEAE
jgi:outer membrane protein